MTETLHIYARVSSDIQEIEGTGLENQIDSGMKVSSHLGYDHKIWNEGSASSSKSDFTNRPVLLELLQAIDRKEVKHLYVHENQRLSRNEETWSIIRLKLVQNEILLYNGLSIHPSDLSNSQDKFILTVMSGLSLYDQEIRTERFRLGKLNRVRSGNWKGGPPPFGYKLFEGKLIPEDNEKKWVKYIYESYADGKTLEDIRLHLMGNGVRTRRNNVIWSKGSIKKILTNTHYNGYWNFEDKKSLDRVRVPCVPIVSNTLFLKVKEEKENRSYLKNGYRAKTSNQKHPYLLKGLMYCSECGTRYSGQHSNSDSKYSNYYCLNRPSNRRRSQKGFDRAPCTVKRTLNLELTDKAIWETFVDVLSQSNLYREELKKVSLGEKSYQGSKTETKKKAERIKRLEKEIKTIIDSIVQLEFEKRMDSDRREILEETILKFDDELLKKKANVEVLSIEVVEGTEQRQWVDWLTVFQKRMGNLLKDDLSIEDKKEILTKFVDKITVESIDKQQHKLTIHFKIPLVDDSLVYKNPSKKSEGYQIADGIKDLILDIDTSKKNFRKINVQH